MSKALITIFAALIMLASSISCVQADTIYTNGTSIEGRIDSVSDGFIMTKQNGIIASYKRSKGDSYFGDYITYRKSPFAKEYTILPCKVFFVDFYNVKIQTPNASNIEIPRYRIKKIELKVE